MAMKSSKKSSLIIMRSACTKKESFGISLENQLSSECYLITSFLLFSKKSRRNSPDKDNNQSFNLHVNFSKKNY